MRTERYFTLRLRAIWRPRLSASRLCYTIHTECQYQGIVKVPGSFRPSALNEHLYSYCNFAELRSRQWGSRYAIRAGRNLPDKEFRYLRMVIVTTAVYRGLNSPLHPKADGSS